MIKKTYDKESDRYFISFKYNGTDIMMPIEKEIAEDEVKMKKLEEVLIQSIEEEKQRIRSKVVDTIFALIGKLVVAFMCSYALYLGFLK